MNCELFSFCPIDENRFDVIMTNDLIDLLIANVNIQRR